MAIREIVKTDKYGKNTPKILQTKCKPVKTFDAETKQLMKDLIDVVILPETGGAGLSACQIGVDARVCVVRDFSYDDEGEETGARNYILVNPEITSKSNATDLMFEGCLSIPDTYGRVQRAKKIKVKALDENGKPIKLKAEGFFARVIQHEIDHMDGILFTQKTIGDLLTEEELDEYYRKRYKQSY